MSRIKVTLIMAGLVVVVAALAVSSSAQPPAGGRGAGGRGARGGAGGPGGFRGGGPGGGFGGGMFGGGMFGGLLGLAQNSAVQEELKVTDRQKESIKKISDEQGPKRQRMMERLKTQTQNAQNQANFAAQQQAQAAVQNSQNANAQNYGGYGGNAFGQGADLGYGSNAFGGGQNQIDPALAQQAAQQQARNAGQMIQNQGRQMMTQGMQMLQREAERDLGRVLDRNQIKRLREIQLQSMGASAVLMPEVAEKLQLSDDQQMEIQQILAQSGQQRREVMMKGFQAFRNFRPNQAGGRGAGGAGRGDTAAGGAAAGGSAAQGAGAGNAQAGDNRRGQRGGQGGQGGPGGGRFDPEAMRKFMERPEVKAQMDASRKANEEIRDREYAEVYKAMDRRQVSNFKKMLGKPFEVSLLMPGPRGAAGRGGNQADTGKTASSDTAKTEQTAKANENSASATSNSSTPQRRQSLRERRGLGAQPSQSSPN